MRDEMAVRKERNATELLDAFERRVEPLPGQFMISALA
jgi:hypothetical protein